MDIDPTAPISAQPLAGTPHCDVDLFEPDVIKDPNAAYRDIREAGPVVWLPKSGVFAIGRYEETKAALADWELFSSSGGPALNPFANAGLQGTTLTSAPPTHDKLRSILGAPLTPTELRSIRDLVERRAGELVDQTIKKESFDGVTEFAQVLPLSIVRALVGLPEEGREMMLHWAAVSFDALGPLNPVTEAALGEVLKEIEFVMAEDLPNRVDKGSWAARVFDAAARGEIAQQQGATMILDYINPSLDTTINATSALLWLFSENPGEWDKLRADPSLIPHTINEVVRLESPIRFFTRVTTRACEVGGVPLPEGARVLMMYGAANRDERKWDDPDRFDVARKPVGQLGFGHGIHACVGQNLARLEISSLLKEMVAKVAAISVEGEIRGRNQILRGFESMTVRFDPA